MRRILIVLSLSLACPAAVTWATCCVKPSGAVTAYTPQFPATGCVAGKRAGSYGGTETFDTDPDFIYQTSVQTKAQLYQYSLSGNDILMATKNNSSDLQCNATTQISAWTTTPSCVCDSALQYYGKFTTTYYMCPNGFQRNDFATSAVAQCP